MLSEQKVLDVLGGKPIFGVKAKGRINLDDMIRNGFPYKANIALQKRLNLGASKLNQCVNLSNATWFRVKKNHGKLSLEVSDRLYRIARIYTMVCEVLEDDKLALDWLMKPKFGLGNKVPFDMLQTEAGTQEVENLLWRIEYGLGA